MLRKLEGDAQAHRVESDAQVGGTSAAFKRGEPGLWVCELRYSWTEGQEGVTERTTTKENKKTKKRKRKRTPGKSLESQSKNGANGARITRDFDSWRIK